MKRMLRRTFLGSAGAAALAAGQAPRMEELKQAAAEMADGRRKLTQEMVDSIYAFGELGYQEFETSKYVTGILEKHGFRVTRGVADLPTAWVAEWGQGSPVIGFMADIDGLPETSQTPGIPWQQPLVEGGPGHGEGHNAGQAVNVTAALVVQELMRRHGIRGTLRVYPGVAEELIGSRTYMVNAGLFRDLDVMLSSHISSEFGTSYGPVGTGLVSVEYTFRGRSARNYRREHLRPEHRSHYVITQGGDQPNVVPPVARVWYYFREWDYLRINELHEIGTRIARAAAMMTDTEMSERTLGAAWPGHFNKPLAEALYDNIRRAGMPQWSEADQALARAAQRELQVKEEGLKTELTELRPPDPSRRSYGSDDIAEVGWNVPTVVLRFPGNIPGMIGHHWSSGISMATPIAHKGATAGAKAHAMTALDLLLNPELLAAAKQYFAEQTKETKWQSLVPVEQKPPVDLNRERMERFRPQMRKFYYDPARYATYLEQLGVAYPTVKKP